MQIGIGLSLCAGTGPGTPVLAAPPNLFSAAQAGFTTSAHVNLQSNWTVAPGDLRQITGNANTNGVRLTPNVPIIPGHPHFLRAGFGTGTPAGNLRLRLAGSGTSISMNQVTTENRPLFQWLLGSEVAGAYPYMEIKPDNDAFDVQITEAGAYDLVTTDPNSLACDVVLCLGDSNMSNTVSDFVTFENLETVFDGRVWYMPCLRSSSTYANTMSTRHVPQPCAEPVQSAGSGARISPLMAFGARFAPYAAARGRPLLLLSLGDAGSGLNSTEDWRKTSAVPTTGARMYGEMTAMLAAMNSLGPAHQVVAAIVSLGANDTTGADYNVTFVPPAQQFIADLRADLGLPNLPICWMTVGEHYEPVSGQDRGARLIAAIESLDQDSGSPNSIPGVVSLRPPPGNELIPGTPTNPHFNAVGMQANGRAMADALLDLL